MRHYGMMLLLMLFPVGKEGTAQFQRRTPHKKQTGKDAMERVSVESQRDFDRTDSDKGTGKMNRKKSLLLGNNWNWSSRSTGPEHSTDRRISAGVQRIWKIGGSVIIIAAIRTRKPLTILGNRPPSVHRPRTLVGSK